jgi:hyperosmotically inducible periplasmic protein
MRSLIASGPLLSIVLAALLAGCAASSAHESTGQYFDDTAITTKVKTELLTAKGVSSSDISVETVNGDVHLSGSAQSELEKQRAAEIAGSVSGVKGVHNDLRLR